MSKKMMYTIVGLWFFAWAIALTCGISKAVITESSRNEYIQANYLQILEGADPNASNTDITMAFIVALFNDPANAIAVGITVAILAFVFGMVWKMANGR